MTRQVIEKQAQSQREPHKEFPPMMNEVNACNLLAYRTITAGPMEAVQDSEVRPLRTQFPQFGNEHVHLLDDCY
jgi:hypothetical protein